MEKFRTNAESRHNPRGSTGLGDCFPKSRPGGFAYDGTQDPEAVIRKKALERGIVEGEAHTVLSPHFVCLLLGQPLTSIWPSVFGEPEVGRLVPQPWG